MIELLSLLIAGHFLADFGLQNDFVARQKADAVRTATGLFAMTAHAMIHGLVATAVVSWFGHDWPVAFWTVALTHWLIDLGKCHGWYGITVDQVSHVIVLTAVAMSLVT